MIDQLFKLERPLIVADCETTGLDVEKDRIVEVALQRWAPDKPMSEWRSLINPGVPIPSGTGHRITSAMVNGCRTCGGIREATEGPFCTCEMFKPWPRFVDIAVRLAEALSNCDLAGKNVRYDLRILAAEFQRAKVEWSYKDARIIDADRLEQLGDPRTLTNLVRKHLGEDMSAVAHGALADVQWTEKLIAAQLVKYDVLPRDLDALHRLQWPGWIDGDGKFVFVKGVPCVGRWGKHAGKPMRQVDPGYWDFIIGGTFSADIKALAADAKLGKFPEERT